jgi:phosphatidylserine decarboxylase
MSSPPRVWLQHLLPKNLLSRMVYRIARSRRPWIKDPLIAWYARTYAVDLTEAETADLRAYPTLNAFFTRALREGARPIAGDEHTVVAPADGILSEYGTAVDGRLLQAKGMHYGLAELLGESDAAVTHLAQGAYMTVYLAPPNYHRVHLPIAGSLTRTTYIPGERFSVSLVSAGAIGGLFCRNERVICWFDTLAGEMAIVLVGALNVSSISTARLDEIASGGERRWREQTPVPYARGAEIARFNLGSTVIVLFQAGAVRWRQGLVSTAAVKVGQPIGRAETSAMS